jgi:hypothetical protein
VKKQWQLLGFVNPYDVPQYGKVMMFSSDRTDEHDEVPFDGTTMTGWKIVVNPKTHIELKNSCWKLEVVPVETDQEWCSCKEWYVPPPPKTGTHVTKRIRPNNMTQRH